MISVFEPLNIPVPAKVLITLPLITPLPSKLLSTEPLIIPLPWVICVEPLTTPLGNKVTIEPLKTSSTLSFDFIVVSIEDVNVSNAISLCLLEV